MIAPRADAEMLVSESPEKRSEQIAGPTALARATRRGRTEKTGKADRTRVTEKRDAEARSLELTLKSLGEELGNTLAERTAAELRAERLADALVGLQVELTAAQSGAERSADAAERELDRMRGEAAELRELMDRQVSEWRIERGALAVERDEVVAELDGVRAELADARGHATRLEKQAAWASDQLALLVETEAATAAELGRKQAEWKVLNIRLDGLHAELRVKEAALRSRDELQSRFWARATRILGAEMQPAAGAIEVLDVLHRRVRELERELDRGAMARERMAVVLSGFERSAYGTGLRVWRSLFEKFGLRRLVSREPRRA